MSPHRDTVSHSKVGRKALSGSPSADSELGRGGGEVRELLLTAALVFFRGMSHRRGREEEGALGDSRFHHTTHNEVSDFQPRDDIAFQISQVSAQGFLGESLSPISQPPKKHIPSTHSHTTHDGGMNAPEKFTGIETDTTSTAQTLTSTHTNKKILFHCVFTFTS